MNYIIYSPLEQFEFITIGLLPNSNNFKWFNLIDKSYLIQAGYSFYYNYNVLNTHSIVIEGICNLSFLEMLGFFSTHVEFVNSELRKIAEKPYIVENLFYSDEMVFNTLFFSPSPFTYDNDISKIIVLWLNVYNSVGIILVAFLLCFIYFNTKFFNLWTYLIDLFFSFLLQTFLSLADKRLLNYFAVFCSFFFLIFLANLTALVPFSFCLTSNLWLTLTLSLSVWISVTLLAIIVRGFGFFLGFIPSNVPAALKAFITVIEVISYLARAISLGVRIFANMLAGHSLVHILSDLVETCIISFNHISLKIFGIFPALILTFILFIEFGICFLQALVFVILTAIYLKEAFGFAAH